MAAVVESRIVVDGQVLLLWHKPVHLLTGLRRELAPLVHGGPLVVDGSGHVVRPIGWSRWLLWLRRHLRRRIVKRRHLFRLPLYDGWLHRFRLAESSWLWHLFDLLHLRWAWLCIHGIKLLILARLVDRWRPLQLRLLRGRRRPKLRRLIERQLSWVLLRLIERLLPRASWIGRVDRMLLWTVVVIMIWLICLLGSR